MSDSASGSTIKDIKTEIDCLIKNQGERVELLSYFTKHKDQQNDALSVLNLIDTEKDKLDYFRNLMKSEQPGAVAKRTHEYSIISTEGPLHSCDDALMLPVDKRDIFKEVISGIYGGKSYIIHGPFQSGKTTFLLELKETIRRQSLNLKYITMPEIAGEILTNKRRGFFKFMSYKLFGKVLSETKTLDKISELKDPYYVLIDEFQYIFSDKELLNMAKDFFRNISSSKVRYVAVGTFILVDLLKNDGELISPFNKASFKLMDLFNTKEMGEIFKQYQINFNKDGVPPKLTAEIIKESCGHPASFMILLKIFNDFRPTVNQWNLKMHQSLAEYMNGTHIKIKHEINNMDDVEKNFLRGLTEHMADHWDVDLSDLTALDDTYKRLLNFGILNIIDSSSIGFTSCVILRVCINALFPTSPERLSRDKVPSDPLDLLALGLKFIDPKTIIDPRAKNKYGPRERAIQASLFSIFNGLLPKPMMCLMELKSSGKQLLDLMITDGDRNLIAYSLKANVTSLETSFKQAMDYAKCHRMQIHLVDFLPNNHSNLHIPVNTGDIILISVKHNNKCTQFVIHSPTHDLPKRTVKTT